MVYIHRLDRPRAALSEYQDLKSVTTDSVTTKSATIGSITTAAIDSNGSSGHVQIECPMISHSGPTNQRGYTFLDLTVQTTAAYNYNGTGVSAISGVDSLTFADGTTQDTAATSGSSYDGTGVNTITTNGNTSRGTGSVTTNSAYTNLVSPESSSQALVYTQSAAYTVGSSSSSSSTTPETSLLTALQGLGSNTFTFEFTVTATQNNFGNNAHTQLIKVYQAGYVAGFEIYVVTSNNAVPDLRLYAGGTNTTTYPRTRYTFSNSFTLNNLCDGNPHTFKLEYLGASQNHLVKLYVDDIERLVTGSATSMNVDFAFSTSQSFGNVGILFGDSGMTNHTITNMKLYQGTVHDYVYVKNLRVENSDVAGITFPDASVQTTAPLVKSVGTGLSLDAATGALTATASGSSYDGTGVSTISGVNSLTFGGNGKIEQSNDAFGNNNQITKLEFEKGTVMTGILAVRDIYYNWNSTNWTQDNGSAWPGTDGEVRIRNLRAVHGVTFNDGTQQTTAATAGAPVDSPTFTGTVNFPSLQISPLGSLGCYISNPNTGSAWLGIGNSWNGTLPVYIQGNLYVNNVQITSDDRLKFNETNITDGLDTIRLLSPEVYDKAIGKDPLNDNTERRKEAGFIAQEVAQIPQLAHTVQEPESERSQTYSVRYNDILAYAVAALKELDTIVQLQSQRIAVLESQSSGI
mgnify:CR=1 FL=1